MITFIERDTKLKNLKNESSRKTSISRKIILKISTFLRRVARSKSRVLNSITSRCIKNCSIWWARLLINVRRDEKLRYLILNWYFLWMTWTIRLNVSFSKCCDLNCSRIDWKTFSRVIWFASTLSNYLIESTWVWNKLNRFFKTIEMIEQNRSFEKIELLKDFLWVIKWLNCFLRANCFFRTSWELSCFLRASCFFRTSWELNCFLWAIEVLSCFLRTSCFFRTNWKLNCFLWAIESRLNEMTWLKLNWFFWFSNSHIRWDFLNDKNSSFSRVIL